MSCEGRIAGRGATPRPAGEGRHEYIAAIAKPPARWPLTPERLELAAPEFAAAWVSERYGVPVALAGTVAALAGLGGAPR